jgi:hypothetical protein
VLILAVLALAACARREFDDLTFEHVSVVNYWAEVEARNTSRQGTAFPAAWALKVRFRTGANLWVRPGDIGPLVQIAYFCAAPDYDTGMGIGVVFSGGYPILRFSTPEEVVARMSALHPTEYDVYIALRRQRTEPSPFIGNPPYEPYDLASAPADVCFHIGGADGMFSRFSSNVVRVPAEAIADAVRHAPASL